MSYDKILIAVDNSVHSLKAAKEGFALARQLKATIGLIFVIDKNKEVVNADLGITPQQSATVLLQEAEETISQLTKMYAGNNEVIRFTPEGFPKKEIIRVSTEWGAGLVIMGSHGGGGLLELLMGSVTQYLIKHSLVPVMVVPAAK